MTMEAIRELMKLAPDNPCMEISDWDPYCQTCITCKPSEECWIHYLMRKNPGRWILYDEVKNDWMCSECNAIQHPAHDTPFDNAWYFCPRCGARLRMQVRKDGSTAYPTAFRSH